VVSGDVTSFKKIFVLVQKLLMGYTYMYSGTSMG
jgi:hypothetical protein